MSRNGSGVYSPSTTGYPAVTGTVIEASKFNAVIEDIAAALTASLSVDGQAVVTADIPMASHKFSGMTAGSAFGDSARFEQLGSYRTYQVLTADTTLTINSIGGLVSLLGTFAHILPAASAYPSGGAIHFRCHTGVPTLTRAGSDNIVFGTGYTTETVITFAVGDSLTLMSNGVDTWHVVAGSILDKKLIFTGGVGANDYCGLPGGRILQWGNFVSSTGGSTHNFPIAFPTACRAILITDSTTSTLETVSAQIASASQFTSKSSSGTPGFYMMAIGF